MGKERNTDNAQESGVALVMALILTTVMLFLIASITYLLLAGFQTNVINREFSTVYEAANGGVEYHTGIINSYLVGATPGDAGSISTDPVTTTLSDIITTCATGTATSTAKTADGKYVITTTLKCLGNQPIPGYGGALRYPPPEGAKGGGTGTTATKYIFYSIIAQAKESSNPQNIGQTEAIYRAMQ